MKSKQMVCIAAVLLLVAGCGPSPEQIVPMTAAAWTPTPLPSPTPTPVPYALTVQITDESGAGIAAEIVLPESGSEEAVQTDASGTYTWASVDGPSGTLQISAPGYHAASQPVTLERGPNELAVVLERDPLGLAAADACAPDEKLLYIEDYQDGKAQGWRNLTAAVDFGAQNGWSIAAMEDGDQLATFTGGHEDLDDMESQVFDDSVWRLRVMTQGTDGFSFLNLRHALKQGGETRYTLQWGANPFLALGRLDFPDVGHFDVARGSMRAKQGQWYYFEIAYYQGSVQVWVDGKTQIEYTDPQPLPAGMISLEAHAPKDPNTKYYFDDHSVCELSAPFTTSMYKPPQ
jgi:hypothetical protein